MLLQTNRIIKIFSVLLSVLFFIRLFLMLFHTDKSLTQDLGRHLTLGKLIWEEKYVPDTNLFSYTYPDFPFINHHWGSEVVFYLSAETFSPEFLIFMKICMIFVAVSLIFLFACNRTGIIPSAGAVYIAILIFQGRTDVRPEIFGYLLYSVFLIILYKSSEYRYSNLLFLLPIITLVWVNLHISFIVAAATYFLFVLVKLIKRNADRKILITGLLIIMSLVINPYGLKGLLYPLQIFGNYGYSIVENQNPFFLSAVMPSIQLSVFKFSLLIMFLLTPVLIIRRKYFEASVVWLTAGLSLTAVRHFSFYALSIVYPLSLASHIFVSFIKSKISLRKSIEQGISVILLAAFSLIFIIDIRSLISGVPYMNNLYEQYGFGFAPGGEKMADFFLEKELQGPIFNNFDDGSYLIYRLYPREKVFVDGRPEAYPADFFQTVYIPMQNDAGTWEKYSEIFGIRTILFTHHDMTPWAMNFLKQITRNRDWVTVYLDSYGIILVRRESADRLQYISSENFTDVLRRRIQDAREEKEKEIYLRLYSIVTADYSLVPRKNIAFQG